MASSSSCSCPSTMFSVTNFVSVKLSESSDYPLWKAQMLCLVQSQDLEAFLDCTSPSPAQRVSLVVPNGRQEVVNPNFLHWRRKDRLVKGWILSSIGRDVLASVVGLDTAKDVWKKLERDFKSLRGELEKKVSGKKEISWHLPLYKAALKGDWESAKKIYDVHNEAFTTNITLRSRTALHMVVESGKAIHFVENMVALMSPGELQSLRTDAGSTALHAAAVVGNKKAADILLKKNSALLCIQNNYGLLPVHYAARYSHRDTLLYLLEEPMKDVMEKHNALAADCKPDDQLLLHIIKSGYFDIALELVNRYPHLAISRLGTRSSLEEICNTPSLFKSSGSNLKCWENLIYSCVPLKSNDYLVSPPTRDVKNQLDSSQRLWQTVRQMLHVAVWDAVGLLVPHIRNIQHRKLLHHQVLQFVKCLCKLIKSSNNTSYYIDHFSQSILLAAEAGICEVVEEIVDTFPDAIWSKNDSDQTIIQLAILNRHEKVFNLVYQMTAFRHEIINDLDKSLNSALHLAGKLAPLKKLNLVSGAALQMQRELQWFKEVEKFVSCPYRNQSRNKSGQLATEVFTEEHRNLVIEGRNWMKEMAKSYSIAAALIVTITFAAAITVPGKAENGLPVFSSQTPFKIFGISDAISLFTSTTSLLMSLSILTARYEEQDFLYSLPKKLILTLLSLILSVSSMMVAFSATLYMVFGSEIAWILIPMAVISCLSFILLQGPLLLNVISTTYGRGIFGKQSDRQFY